MLQTSYIIQNKETVIERLSKRGFDAAERINDVIALDESRKAKQLELDNTLAQSNKISKEIGMLFKSGKQQEAEQMKTETLRLKDVSKKLKDELDEIVVQVENILYEIPNVPHQSVPKGNSEDDNETISQHGDIPQLHQEAIPHWELAKKYNLIDFELGNKITGAGFPVYKGKGARLQRALISYFLDKNTGAGYTEYQPPLLINEASGYGTGQLPDKEGQMYHVTNDNLYLIPTAEVPITNIFRNELLRKEDLPICCTAYTPCFRREAGSYGAHVRGLNRLHQFDKVEIVRLEEPQNSYTALDQMVNHVKEILEELKLPYRILRLCGGDLGFTSALTYDFEVYSTAQEKWLEVSSVSNFETFQANRLKLRYKDADNNNQLLHTLNGSALALPRILAAILENYQTEKGIDIPEILVPYTKFTNIN